MTVNFEFRGDRDGVAFDDTVGWEFRVTYGRRSWAETNQPATLEMFVVWSSASLGAVNINDWQLGDKIRLECRVLAHINEWVTFFYGSITDVVVDKDVIRVIAVALPMATMGRTWIDVPEMNNVSVQAACTTVINAAIAAGAWVGSLGAAYGGLTQTNISVPAQTNANALQVLNQILQSEPNGLLTERYNNLTSPQLGVRGYQARRVASLSSSLKFDLSAESDAILAGWRVEKRVSDLVNKAVISYNNGIETFADTVSVAALGTYSVSANTNLNLATDANYLARRYVVRNNDPAWRVEPITVDMPRVTNSIMYHMVRYTITGAWVRIPALYAGAQTDYFIEGYSDTIRYSSTPGGTKQWFRTLFVTDVNATDAAQRWQDVTSGVTWATVNPAYTWLDLEEIDI